MPRGALQNVLVSSGASDQASPTATRASAGPFARLQTASPESAGSLEFGQSAPPAPKDGQFQDTQQGFATPRFFQTDVSSSLTGDLGKCMEGEHCLATDSHVSTNVRRQTEPLPRLYSVPEFPCSPAPSPFAPREEEI